MNYGQSDLHESTQLVLAKQMRNDDFKEDPDPRTFLERLADRAIESMTKEPVNMAELLEHLDYLQWACGASGRHREEDEVRRIHDRIERCGLSDRELDLENLRRIRKAVGEVIRR